MADDESYALTKEGFLHLSHRVDQIATRDWYPENEDEENQLLVMALMTGVEGNAAVDQASGRSRRAR